jgi:metal-responsive CopG/Arc/MetJ family transcriptional regulator
MIVSFYADGDLLKEIANELGVEETRSEFIRQAIRAEIDRRKKAAPDGDVMARLADLDERLRRAGI